MENQYFSFPPPVARALLHGDAAHPQINGEVLFSPYGRGTLTVIRAVGLPPSQFLGFHIHENGICTTGGDIAFSSAGGHYDPHHVQHPFHAGDLSPILTSADGVSVGAVYSDRFRPADVVGRSVILHGSADDFHSQPSGDSGMRIACGIIQSLQK